MHPITILKDSPRSRQPSPSPSHVRVNALDTMDATAPAVAAAAGDGSGGVRSAAMTLAGRGAHTSAPRLGHACVPARLQQRGAVAPTASFWVEFAPKVCEPQEKVFSPCRPPRLTRALCLRCQPPGRAIGPLVPIARVEAYRHGPLGVAFDLATPRSASFQFAPMPREVLVPGDLLPDKHKQPGRLHVSRHAW